MSWFVDRVLPGLLTSLPIVVISVIGLWLNWKKTVQHVRRENEQQTERIVERIREQEAIPPPKIPPPPRFRPRREQR